MLQWEDFSKQKAFDVLEKYQDAHLSFNDDIQGTGAVVLSGLEEIVRATAANTPYPVVFALSNPTASCEALPAGD